jgi:aspartate kinase
VEASAVSINVCLNDERIKVELFIDDLKPEFDIIYNENAEMLTIRHYTPESVARITDNREILLEQRTRHSVRFVVRKAMQTI